MPGRKGKSADNKGRHWKDQEVKLLLNIVEETLPRGQQEWLTVVTEYNQRRIAWMAERDEEQIRNKFKALRNTKKPTGDPTCPPNIRRAKQLMHLIERRCSVTTMDDSDSDGEVGDVGEVGEVGRRGSEDDENDDDDHGIFGGEGDGESNDIDAEEGYGREMDDAPS
jgi:hypothetical protein